MINLTKLWTGVAQPADSLRYGHASGHAAANGGSDGPSCMPVAARARKPITVWNITRTCNLRCVHCYSDSAAAQYPGELDWEQMEKVVEDLAAYQVPSLLLSGGEPMIHPRFFELVDLASSKGLKLTISTNGTLITPEKAALLKAANVAYVGISLDGIGKIHDEFRRKEGAFDGAVRGFKNCHDVDQKTGLRLTLTRHNVENIEQILDFIEDKEIKYGNTPEQLFPYNKFRQAYKYHFVEPIEFNGPGRDKKPPAGLSEVRIGFLGPLTEDEMFFEGKNMLNGALLALEQANAKAAKQKAPGMGGDQQNS